MPVRKIAHHLDFYHRHTLFETFVVRLRQKKIVLPIAQSGMIRIYRIDNFLDELRHDIKIFLLVHKEDSHLCFSVRKDPFNHGMGIPRLTEITTHEHIVSFFIHSFVP